MNSIQCHTNQKRFDQHSGIVSIALLLVLNFVFFSTWAQTSSKTKAQTVVIDAGHGGHDPGCLGASNKEKEVCLAIALKLGKLIEQRLPAVKVVYTRTTDVFLELQERAKIANKSNADLFICIHANAAGPDAYGSETYVLGLHKSEANLEVAKRENSVILLEDNYETKYAGFDPNSVESIITMTLMQSAYLSQSTLMASNIQKNFEKSGRRNRGVKQAGYWVLHATAMPSVLIETGFLTNKEEEAYLSNPNSQSKIAEDIYMAFVDYKASLESTPRVSPKENKEALDQALLKKDSVQKEVPKSPKTDTSIPVISNPTVTLVDSGRSKDPKLETKQDVGKVVYRVQIKTAPKPIALVASNFYGMNNVYEYKDKDGVYKYTVGEASQPSELDFLQKSMQAKGSKGAFIIATLNGKRITLTEAKTLTQQK